MSTIWKYHIPVGDKFTLNMPKGAKIIALQVQLGTPCMWAIVEPDACEKERTFVVIGTGHKVPAGTLEFIDTFQVDNSRLVFHVFEVL